MKHGGASLSLGCRLLPPRYLMARTSRCFFVIMSVLGLAIIALVAANWFYLAEHQQRQPVGPASAAVAR